MNTTSKYLGVVEFSGKVIISDPCYDRGTWCMQMDFPVKPGRYHVYAVFSDEEVWGIRVASLLFRHESIKKNLPSRSWREVASSIGVDSGQCGIFDDTIYPQTKDHPDNHPFYEECCGITLAEEQAGILQSGKGVVSSSGYGDGCYGLSVIEQNGENVALLLDYDLVKMRQIMRSLVAAAREDAK